MSLIRRFLLPLLLNACLCLAPRSVSMGRELVLESPSAHSAPAAPMGPVHAGSRGDKPLHQVVACYSLLLGVSGVFLAFATGPLVPLAVWAVAAFALQICGG